ncbi:MAG: ABC transporter ATP-binding protein [Candidatus Odinarchaeota archaeon]
MTVQERETTSIAQTNQLLNVNGKNDVITLQKVSKTYTVGENSVVALSDVNLEVKRGELLVILGPSGSGKTTLLNVIGGIDLPSMGSVEVDRIVLDSKKQMEKVRKEKIGFVFQFFNLLPNLSARENVEYVLELTKQRNKRENAQDYLSIVGLSDRGDHFPAQLSGGEQQRVAIARALAKNPLVILADEPTGELDFETGIRILKLLNDLARTRGTTVIIVTHNQEIAKIADRIIRLSSGEVKSIEDNKMKKIDPERLNW